MIVDVLLVLSLIVLNGAFALSEIAIVSSRRARLVQLADAGSAGARRALALAAEPTRFLSSVQIGITTIGILSGAIGEASIAARLRGLFEQTPLVAAYADGLSLGLMVVVLTYVSLVVGELVPKRLALTSPERVAALIARPIDLLGRLGRPFVYVLTISTDAILRIVGAAGVKPPAVTVEEIKVLVEQGTEEGVFDASEREMVTNVLNLDDRHVGSIMTPRAEIDALDVREPIDEIRRKMQRNPHNVLPLCDGGLDHVLGFVRTVVALEQLLVQGRIDLAAAAQSALFVPEGMTLMKLLQQFKRTHFPVALVVDEFGGVAGIVSLSDVISAIVGELPTEADEEPSVVRREDGSWLLDGGLDIDTVSRTLDDDRLVSDADRPHFHTLGGLAMLALGRVPRIGDIFERGRHRFEVVDMDGHRVDRVLASRRETQR